MTEREAGDATQALRGLQWNWGEASDHGCSRALDRAPPGQRPMLAAKPGRAPGTHHRGLRGAAGPPRRGTAHQRMTGAHELPPVLAAHVQAAALRSGS